MFGSMGALTVKTAPVPSRRTVQCRLNIQQLPHRAGDHFFGGIIIATGNTGAGGNPDHIMRRILLAQNHADWAH